jgi:hypothetical protein
MLSRHLRHHAVAYLALVVALSTGTSYAAVKIANGSVTTKKLANNAVKGAKVKDGSLTGADLLDRSVTGADLLDRSVGGSDLALGAVGSSELLDGSVTDDDLATGSVGSAEVKNGSLTAPDLSEGSVGTDEVKDGSLRAQDLAATALPQVTVTHGAGSTDPVANPDDRTFSSTSVTVARAGQVYVRWSKPTLGVTCSAGAATMGLYVDGAPVPGTSTPVPADTAPAFAELVGTVNLAVGPHPVTVGVDCLDTSTVATVGGAGAVTWTTIVPAS